MSLNTTLRSGRVVGLVCLICVLAALLVFQNPGGVPYRWPSHDSPTDSSPPPYEQLPETEYHGHPPPPSHPPGAHLPPRPPGAAPHTDEYDAKCDMFPDPGNIAIALKTGATEAVGKIPILMLTALRCAENVMIFSDIEQNIAGHHLHDALEDIPESAMEDNPDFDFYKHLKEAKKYGEIEAMLGGARDPKLSQDFAAWTLDKYKQLHILEKLYEQYPDKDWYMMIDADTYLVWPNLLTWLPQLPDPRENKLYLGSPAKVADVYFAHGGSGMLLSHATMYDFAVTHPGSAAAWDVPMRNECCGDLIIGTVLKQNGILLKSSWPTINGEKPITLPFGPTHWCQPVVTMHHVMPSEVNQLAYFEEGRNLTTPLTFSELFDAFVKDVLPDSIDHWENYCNDMAITVDTFEDCQKACEDDDRCFQFNLHGDNCVLGHSIHLGEPKAKRIDGMVWHSGWLRDRIRQWTSSQEPCQPEFPNTFVIE